MKIVQINGAVFGSTGKIMLGIAQVAEEQGHEVLCAAPITKTNRRSTPAKDYIKIGTYYGRCASVLLSRLTGLDGCFAVFPTLKLLRKISEFQPDVIHLHNIHGSYLNLPLLFRFIKRNHTRVIWTLHDCWAFTGHCPHFEMAGCDKWKTECHNCPQYKAYPKSYVDNAKLMHVLKKKWFLGVRDMTIITPSNWLAGIVRQSFLKEYPVKTIPNGIDLSIFKPTPSNFRERYAIPEEKKILLGVAFGWGARKGLDVFVELAKRLDDSYQIVLVGTDENVDRCLPENIISIHQTNNQQELAEIYSAADLFVNPSQEETMGLVTVEALACGTPAVVFDRTAVPEVVDANSGKIVKTGDIQALLKNIKIGLKLNPEGAKTRGQCYEQTEQYNKYIAEYCAKDICSQRIDGSNFLWYTCADFCTGGSPETPDETCGAVVDKNDVDAMEEKIRMICKQRNFSQQACLARASSFSENERCKDIVREYAH